MYHNLCEVFCLYMQVTPWEIHRISLLTCHNKWHSNIACANNENACKGRTVIAKYPPGHAGPPVHGITLTRDFRQKNFGYWVNCR